METITQEVAEDKQEQRILDEVEKAAASFAARVPGDVAVIAVITIHPARHDGKVRLLHVGGLFANELLTREIDVFETACPTINGTETVYLFAVDRAEYAAALDWTRISGVFGGDFAPRLKADLKRRDGVPVLTSCEYAFRGVSWVRRES